MQTSICERDNMLLRFTTFVFGSLVLAAMLSAAENELPGVTVFGTATTQVAPDQMVWHLTANNRGPKLSIVAEQHTKLVQQVLGFLKEHGIKDSDLQTSQMEFGENWEYRTSRESRKATSPPLRFPSAPRIWPPTSRSGLGWRRCPASRSQGELRSFQEDRLPERDSAKGHSCGQGKGRRHGKGSRFRNRGTSADRRGPLGKRGVACSRK